MGVCNCAVEHVSVETKSVVRGPVESRASASVRRTRVMIG